MAPSQYTPLNPPAQNPKTPSASIPSSQNSQERIPSVSSPSTTPSESNLSSLEAQTPPKFHGLVDVSVYMLAATFQIISVLRDGYLS